MKINPFLQNDGRLIIFDGGMGTLLQEAGLPAGEYPEKWNLDRPESITSIHCQYLEAGANVLTTNTFGAYRAQFPEDGAYPLTAIVQSAVSCARKAIERNEGCAGAHIRPHYVALDLGPLGKLLKPSGTLSFADAYALFAEKVKIGAQAGADLILIETMGDTYEIKAAVLAAKENCDLPIFVTATFDSSGRLLTGGDIPAVAVMLEGLGVDGIGINCGLGPRQIQAILPQLLENSRLPIIINPNAGLPRSEKGRTVFDVAPEDFAAAMQDIAQMGVSGIGGCCGTTPGHIAAMVKRCDGMKIIPRETRKKMAVSSYARAVEIGDQPVIIGERINPTGKAKFKEALRANDLDYILKEGLKQQENGAHILDVNVGLPEIDEAAMMESVVSELQAVIDLPLQIDTANISAMERAMRVYNGKPLLNSVNGKRESMDAVFPLVKKYGAVVVALTLDEDGIPETVEGRLAIAKKIYRTAESYGIAKEDILIDTLTMTVSANPNSANITLETLRRVRVELGGRVILGVSNVSFGLPQRETLNSAFFTMALQNGLSAAIINPNSEAMTRAYYVYRALAGQDAQFADYINRYADAPAPVLSTPAKLGAAAKPGDAVGVMTLGNVIEKGLKDSASALTTELLRAGMAPMDVINQELIPALNNVGQGFEKGRVFLPQLLMSAEAARCAFDLLKEKMKSGGQLPQKKAKIVLATVRGDIHDIGKNIVKVLLENYDFDVIDLGKDVAPETIAAKVVETRAEFAGLSALMTTTVPAMEETIRQLRDQAPWCLILVGGAVMTKNYAEHIGADVYCRDAMAGVTYAESTLPSSGADSRRNG